MMALLFESQECGVKLENKMLHMHSLITKFHVESVGMYKPYNVDLFFGLWVVLK